MKITNRKVLALLLAAVMLISPATLLTLAPDFSIKAAGVEFVAGGTIADSSLAWTVFDDGVLNISADGPMPDFVHEAPWFAYRSAIKALKISEGVTSIGSHAFAGCVNLQSAKIAESVTHISDSAFAGSGLYTAWQASENAVLYIDNCLIAYQAPTVQTLAVAAGTRLIADCAFASGGISGISIPSSVKHIGESALNSADLVSITVDAANTSFSSEGGVLYNADKTELIRCPQGSSMEAISIPNSVTSICKNAFYGCSSLQSISIPNSCLHIGENAFTNSGYYNEATNWINGVLYISTCLIDTNSGFSASSYETDSGTSLIAEKAFAGCAGLTDIKINGTAVHINARAFESCSGMLSADLSGAALEFIGDGAFADCSSLQSLTIPSSVTAIGSDVFSGCVSLASIAVSSENTAFSSDTQGILYDAEKTAVLYVPAAMLSDTVALPETVSTISEGAFDNCSALKTVNIPVSLTTVPAGVFASCANLSEIVVSEDNPQFSSENGALYNKVKTRLICVSPCGLESFTTPESVIVVSPDAFANCTDLKTVNVTSKVETLGNGNPFANCTSLERITVAASNTHYISDSGGILYALKSDNSTEIVCYPIAGAGTNFTVLPSCKSIGENAFANCGTLESFSGEQVSVIGRFAFANCTALSSVSFSGVSASSISAASEIYTSYASIGEGAFKGCVDLTSFYVPSGINFLAASTFEGCAALNDITLSAEVTYISENALSGCSATLTLHGSNGSYAQAYSLKNNIAFVEIPNITLSAPSAVCTPTVAVSGTTLANIKVVIYDGNAKIGETTSSAEGLWRTTVALNNPIDGTNHALRAKINIGTINEAVSYTVTCFYSQNAVAFTGVTIMHAGQQRDITAASLNVSPAAMNFVSGDKFTFKITIANADISKALYVVSTHDAESKKIAAVYDIINNCYIASGMFDSDNPDYIPGEISFEYDGEPISFGTKINITFFTDASWFVYEAIYENRVDNASATIYYKNSSGNAEVWSNAEAYGQTATVTTDSTGSFAWNLPDGEWLVEVKKDGYADAKSEWFTLPSASPVKLAIGLIAATTAPEVKFVKAYSDCIELGFTQYMDSASVNFVHVNVLQNDATVSGTWNGVDDGSSPGEKSYNSIFRFLPSSGSLSGEYTVIVKNDTNAVKKYNGVPIADEYRTDISVGQRVSSITAPSALSLDYGETAEIEISALPADTTAGMTVSIVPDNSYSLTVPKSVTLDSSGKATVTVSAKTPGDVTLSFALDGCLNENVPITAKTRIDIAMINPIRVTGIAVSPTEQTLVIGGSRSLTATVSPADATYTLVSWSSSAPKIATVDETGIVTAVSPGKATITVKSDDGSFAASCVVTVRANDISTAAVTAVERQLYTGKAISPAIKVTFGGAELVAGTDYIVSYSNNINVGTASITVTGKGIFSGSKTSTFEIYSETEVKKEITFSFTAPENPTVKYGETLSLTASFADAPEGAYLLWSSSDESVAEVSQKGVVTGKGNSSAVITVSLVDADGNILKDDNGVSLTASVTVKATMTFWQRIVAFFQGLFGKIFGTSGKSESAVTFIK